MDIRSVSKLGFGTSQIGGPSVIGGKLVGPDRLNEKEALAILDHAYENGISFFDTSDKYGNAEELLGKAFGRVRDKVVIATKCGLTEGDERDFSIGHIDRCLGASLKRLKSDYIDIFQLAKPDPADVTDELLAFMEKKTREGRIRRFGISVSGSKDGAEFLKMDAVGSMQIFYNVLFTQDHELIAKTASRGKFVVVRSPLNSGMLSGRYTLGTSFGSTDPRGAIFSGEVMSARLSAIEKMKKRFGLASDEVMPFALNFILSNESVGVVIPAASKLDQLKGYIAVFRKMRRLSRSEIEEVVSFSRREMKLGNI